MGRTIYGGLSELSMLLLLRHCPPLSTTETWPLTFALLDRLQQNLAQNRGRQTLERSLYLVRVLMLDLRLLAGRHEDASSRARPWGEEDSRNMGIMALIA